ncbi:MAG: hypothetical protein Q8N12_05715 [Thermodesulfovibrionales bacterium]|nr:hypothetical protein [Thermodesulfovibrionales bacterium]
MRDARNEKLSPLVREIGWTHNVIILINCKGDLEREFYIGNMIRSMRDKIPQYGGWICGYDY